MKTLLTILALFLIFQVITFLFERFLRKASPRTRVSLYKYFYLYLPIIPLAYLSPFYRQPKDHLFLFKIQEFSLTQSLSEGFQKIPTELAFSLESFMTTVYFTLVVILVLKLALEYLLTRRKLSRGSYEQKDRSILTKNNFSIPFCFGLLKPKIYWPQELLQEGRSAQIIYEHESVHAQNKDPLWLFSSRLLSCFLWFSPLTPFFHKRFIQLIEENCDEQTIINLKVKPEEYGKILLTMATSPQHYSLVTPLNKSNLKSRILTITSRTKKMKQLKFLYLGLMTAFTLNIYSTNNLSLKESSVSLARPTVFDIKKKITIIDPQRGEESVYSTKVIINDGYEGFIPFTAESPDASNFDLKIKINKEDPWAQDPYAVTLKLAFRMEEDENFMDFQTIKTRIDEKHQLEFNYGPSKTIRINYQISERQTKPQKKL
jgi:beta-lactamase regulating signal transducer with metallopeptidase domain